MTVPTSTFCRTYEKKTCTHYSLFRSDLLKSFPSYSYFQCRLVHANQTGTPNPPNRKKVFRYGQFSKMTYNNFERGPSTNYDTPRGSVCVCVCVCVCMRQAPSTFPLCKKKKKGGGGGGVCVQVACTITQHIINTLD